MEERKSSRGGLFETRTHEAKVNRILDKIENHNERGNMLRERGHTLRAAYHDLLAVNNAYKLMELSKGGGGLGSEKNITRALEATKGADAGVGRYVAEALEHHVASNPEEGLGKHFNDVLYNVGNLYGEHYAKAIEAHGLNAGLTKKQVDNVLNTMEADKINTKTNKVLVNALLNSKNSSNLTRGDMERIKGIMDSMPFWAKLTGRKRAKPATI